MGDFELDTRVEGANGRYRARLSRDWEIWGPNGGYLATIALRAVGREAKVGRPASFHGHFLSVARFEDVEIEVTPVRVGRRTESFRVSMAQQGKPVFEGLVRTAAEGPGLAHREGDAPDVPAPERLKSWAQLAEERDLGEGPSYPFWENLEARPTEPDRIGDRTTRAPPRMVEWYRFRPREIFEDPWTDAGRSVVLIDTLSWPAAARAHTPTEFTAPSLDVTVWFHRPVPREPWLLADQVSPIGEAGLIGCLGRVWCPGGKLVASGGSQLLCVPPSAR